MFGVCKLIDILVPDIPASLDIKMKRERFLAKEALQDAEHVLQVVCGLGSCLGRSRVRFRFRFRFRFRLRYRYRYRY